MKIIGLTGGIASGKTTVSHYLAEKHRLPIIDADLISHQVFTSPEIQTQLFQAFADYDVFTSDHQQINRSRLGQLVFSHPQLKTQLEAIIHPPVILEIKQQLRNLQEQGRVNQIILVAPLLVETELRQLCDEIIVLNSFPDIQLQRLTLRHPDLTQPQIQNIINSQTAPQERNLFASHLISNNSSLDDLFSQVDQIISSS